MQTQQSNVKFPWIALAIVVAIAAAWGYTHRGKEDLVVALPRQAPEASAPVAVKPPMARDAVARIPAEKPSRISRTEMGGDQETLRIHPLDEPDPEVNADPAQVEQRNEVERRIHSVQHGAN